MRLEVNGKVHELDAPPEMPLLWVLRDVLGLTGTKFGCGVGCAAPARCTSTASRRGPARCRVGGVAGKRVTTIEGLVGRPLASGAEGLDRRATCRNAATASRADHGGRRAARRKTRTRPTRDIDARDARNICRCGTYNRIRKAIHRAAGG